MFAVASDVYGDKLPSANGGINIMFWEQLVSPLFQFLGCLETVPSVGSSKNPLGFRIALCPTACESAAGSSVLELDKGTILPFFTFFLVWGGWWFLLVCLFWGLFCFVFLRTWASSANLWGHAG